MTGEDAIKVFQVRKERIQEENKTIKSYYSNVWYQAELEAIEIATKAIQDNKEKDKRIAELEDDNKFQRTRVSLWADVGDERAEKIESAIKYVKEKMKTQYKYALSHIECDEILKILE